jgi:hypothetical protein
VERPYAGVDRNAHWSHDPAAWAKFHRTLSDAITRGK